MLATLIVLRTLVVAAALALICRRARRERAAVRTWRSYRAGFALLLVSSALETVLYLAGSPIGAAGLVAVLPLRLTSTAACFFLYHGIATWYRSHEKSRPAGRVDWLVGVSCVLGAAGTVNLWVDVPTGLDGCADQLRLVNVSSIAVLLSAVVAISLVLPRPVRGRALTVAASVLGVLLTQVLYLVTGPTTMSVLVAWAAWVSMCAAYAWLALLRPVPVGRWHPSAAGVPVAASAGLLLGLTALVGAGLDDGSSPWAVVYGAAAIAGSGTKLIRLIRDLADHDRARRQASTDDLTGLANRRAFLERLSAETVAGRAVGVLLLDLDRFKEVNDQHGHAAGDELLVSMSVALESAVPGAALLARLGGDEFAVVLPAAGPEDALAVGRRMLAAAVVPASIGVATSTGADGLAGAELLRRADTAMYAAKTSGRGVALHDDATDRAWRQRAALSDELHAALGPGAPQEAAAAFEVHYQPQVSLADGSVVGVEALVRWNHPRLGLLAPGGFLDVLEERGLMPALTVHVARRATADLAAWRAAGHHLRLSINTSSTSLSDPQLLELLDEVARDTDPADVVVEVTETSLMIDPERALATCQDITGRGFALSIDDFGTGYSSLAYLANLPATEVKIDRAFTSRALHDERIAAIVAGTVELAHHLGLRVVAEGVEDEATLDLLADLGAEESQGYLHSRPLPAAQLLSWLERRGARPQPAPTPRPAPAPPAPAAVPAPTGGTPAPSADLRPRP